VAVFTVDGQLNMSQLFSCDELTDGVPNICDKLTAHVKGI